MDGIRPLVAAVPTQVNVRVASKLPLQTDVREGEACIHAATLATPANGQEDSELYIYIERETHIYAEPAQCVIERVTVKMRTSDT